MRNRRVKAESVYLLFLDGIIDKRNDDIAFVVDTAAEQASVNVLFGNAERRIRKAEIVPFGRNYHSFTAVGNTVKTVAVLKDQVTVGVRSELLGDSRLCAAIVYVLVRVGVETCNCGGENDDNNEKCGKQECFRAFPRISFLIVSLWRKECKCFTRKVTVHAHGRDQ